MRVRTIRAFTSGEPTNDQNSNCNYDPKPNRVVPVFASLTQAAHLTLNPIAIGTMSASAETSSHRW